MRTGSREAKEARKETRRRIQARSDALCICSACAKPLQTGTAEEPAKEVDAVAWFHITLNAQSKVKGVCQEHAAALRRKMKAGFTIMELQDREQALQIREVSSVMDV